MGVFKLTRQEIERDYKLNKEQFNKAETKDEKHKALVGLSIMNAVIADITMNGKAVELM